MAHDVFLSYSDVNRNVANAIVAHLEARGVRCWIAHRDVQAGSVWTAEVLGALKASRALVLVWSKDSNLSDQVLRELERSVHANIPIIPFRIDEATPREAVEYLLATTHWLDALTPPLERHIERLGDSLEALLAHAPLERKAPSPPPPPPWRLLLPRLVLPLGLVGLGVGAAYLFGWVGGKEPVTPSPRPPALDRSDTAAGTEARGGSSHAAISSSTDPAPAAPHPAPDPSTLAPTRIEAPWIEHLVQRPEGMGLLIHAKVVIADRAGRSTVLRATFERPDGTPLKDLDGLHALAGGEVAVERKLTPGEARASFEDLDLFLPYADLHVIEDQAPGEQKHALAYRLRLLDETGGPPLAETAAQAFEVKATRPAEGWAGIRRVWVSSGKDAEGVVGVVVHAEISVDWRRGKDTLISATFRWPDGQPLKDLDGRFTTPNGTVATGDTVVPRFERAAWDDLQLFLPYEQLHLKPGQIQDLEVVLQVVVPESHAVLTESAPAAFQAGTR